MLIAFGAAGRREVERLKSSPNPAVRRTAIFLLREFGGSEALPELTELLNDRSAADPARGGPRHPQPRHRTARFEVLQQALTERHRASPARRS